MNIVVVVVGVLCTLPQQSIDFFIGIVIALTVSHFTITLTATVSILTALLLFNSLFPEGILRVLSMNYESVNKYIAATLSNIHKQQTLQLFIGLTRTYR